MLCLIRMDAHHVDEADMLDHAAPTCNAVAIFRVGDVGRAANPYPAFGYRTSMCAFFGRSRSPPLSLTNSVPFRSKENHSGDQKENPSPNTPFLPTFHHPPSTSSDLPKDLLPVN